MATRSASTRCRSNSQLSSPPTVTVTNQPRSSPSRQSSEQSPSSDKSDATRRTALNSRERAARQTEEPESHAERDRTPARTLDLVVSMGQITTMMHYNLRKQAVVRDIHDRIFRAHGML